jgi:hypothetical protein
MICHWMGDAGQLREKFYGRSSFALKFRPWSATGRSRRRAQLPNFSQALPQALKLRTDLRFHGVL